LCTCFWVWGKKHSPLVFWEYFFFHLLVFFLMLCTCFRVSGKKHNPLFFWEFRIQDVGHLMSHAYYGLSLFLFCLFGVIFHFFVFFGMGSFVIS
jgi:hypothetical protein